MERQKLKIGLFGFGCVGKGLYDVLLHTKGLKAEITNICVKDKEKKRSLPTEFFTYDKFDILNDESINVIVELIDDADAAFDITRYAMQKGKAVVSANKKMIAEHFNELLELQRNYNVPFLYEGAACASIPVIRNLEEYYDNDLLNSIEGIVNGSINYILTKMHRDNLDYSLALKETQELGFAESDPTLDVAGYDARYKLSLLAAHAFGVVVAPEDIFCHGIQTIGKEDLQYAKEKGYKIKLIARAVKNKNKLALSVIPQFISFDDILYNIDDENNGLCVEGVFSDKQFFAGKGAGSYPTGSAVLSDISALTYNYRYEYKKLLQESGLKLSNDHLLKIYCRYPASVNVLDLPFEKVIEEYKSQSFNYKTGFVKLSDLKAIDLAQSKDIFIACLPENHFVVNELKFAKEAFSFITPE